MGVIGSFGFVVVDDLLLLRLVRVVKRKDYVGAAFFVVQLLVVV